MSHTYVEVKPCMLVAEEDALAYLSVSHGHGVVGTEL